MHCIPSRRLTAALLTSFSAFGLFPPAGSRARADEGETRAERPLSAGKAAATMEVPAGFRVTVFAAEPQVTQPIGLTTDARGRLWVAENHTYAESRINFDLERYDRIAILEDTDGDGRSDRRKVFWEEAQQLTSVEVGFGGVWALAAPRLLFVPDRDGDDVPDGEPEVLLDGWNSDAVRHNIVNGLKWGPDGWLYGRHGIQATSLVGAPGTPPSARVKLNCSIWRYHPTRRVFEVVTHGTTNSWGMDYDDHGQMFFINTVIGHLWHVIPGAHYRRMYGADFNEHAYGLMDQCADHYHWDTKEAWQDVRKGVTDETLRAGGGHAHSGLMIYLGDNWPDRYRNTLFTVNFHGRRLNNDRLVRGPGGYVGRHAPDFLQSRDPWFRAIDMVYGPDGAVYLADWSDTGECHENDGVDRASGRIYKIAYGEPPRPDGLDLSRKDAVELAELQLHPNDWYVRQARRILQERAARSDDLASAHAELHRLFASHPDARRKLRALWSLHATGGIDAGWLLRQLAHDDEHVRLWALRLLVGGGDPGPEARMRIAERAADEPSVLVRLFLASAMQRLPLEARWPVAQALASRAEDASDPALPLMVWYGIEPAVPEDPRRAARLAAESRIPLLSRYIARRLTSEIERRPEGIEHLLDLIARREDAALRLEVLEGMRAALEGWRRAPAPASWTNLVRALEGSPDEAVRRAARELGVVFGDGRAVDELRRIIGDEKADPASRRSALRALVESRPGDLAGLLHRLLDDRVLSTEAARGLAAYPHPETPQRLLARYGRLDPDGRKEAIQTLVSRREYALELLKAVERGRLDRGEVTAYHARQIESLADDTCGRLLAKVWGKVGESSAEKKERIAELRALLVPDRIARADLSRGRALFQKLCASCHTLYGEGGRIAPDLTGSDRRNLEYLIENIVDPSATLVADFKVSVVVLKDGRVLTGVVVERTEKRLALQTQEERLYVPVADVADVAPQEQSLMPEGLLEGLGEEEIRDLFAYLSGTRQAPLPEGEK